MMSAIKDKWDIVYSQEKLNLLTAAPVLIENSFLLPKAGTALDMACGLGGNAIFLAQNGLRTNAWDISGIAIEKLQIYADLAGLQIFPKQCEINEHLLVEYKFDVIVVSRFLDRSLCKGIMGALKKGGLLFYQTYTREKCRTCGPDNPEYLLQQNELLTLFSKLKLVFYRDNGLIGNCKAGFRNEAQFIGQKN
jgi:tellurite methyltransferase